MVRPTSTGPRSRARSIARALRASWRVVWSRSSATPPSPRSAPSSTPSTHRIARRSGVSRRRNPVARADRAFGILLGVAFAASAILIALLLTQVPRVEQLIARGPEDAADVAAALVLILALCGISLGLATLFRQLAATAMLIRRLVSQKVAVPRSVALAASGLDLDGRIDVVADGRPFSFCYWFMRPRICLSTALVDRLDIDELRAVLLHER